MEIEVLLIKQINANKQDDFPTISSKMKQETERIIDNRLSVKIIQQARRQQAEIDDELLHVDEEDEQVLRAFILSGTCALREAIIISSIIAKTSVPMLHSAAALLKIAEMNYSGVNSIFIRILVEKRFALPFRVVDGPVLFYQVIKSLLKQTACFYSIYAFKFCTDERELPDLWHQALLSFIQYYRQDISYGTFLLI
ncbi:unnamed protein product [Didymodactylos carnosus]|uniref:Bystin n=1 Tax=Didymodactylos carnosus TaxID=1234261 RepID=A0A8S2D9X3_9BILA|nr:unnamed protein product [Didymodactylos carnosus]CAF3690674.1 unnamed protein product [Didymodactylos carnosus]